MNANSSTARRTELDDPALQEADSAAVLERLVSGKRLDPVVEDRIRARAERATEAIRQTRGLVDDDTFHSLLDDEA